MRPSGPWPAPTPTSRSRRELGMAETKPAAPAKPGAIRRADGAFGRVAKFAFVGDTRDIRQIHAGVRARIHRLLHPGQYAHHETFAEACQRLGVSPADVEQR